MALLEYCVLHERTKISVTWLAQLVSFSYMCRIVQQTSDESMVYDPNLRTRID